jgi:DNA (cytosine-5)-methyltransferase 1
MVMEPFTFDARGNGDGKTVSTITGCHEAFVSDFTSVVGMPIQDAPVYCLQGNGIDRADTAGCNGKGVKEDVCYTLNTIDRPAVAFQTYQKVTGPLMANSHPGSYTGQDAFSDMLVAGVDARNATECPELTGAPQADAAHNLNSNNVVRIQYIVRRLTPTECARLQGFPDKWGHPNWIDENTKGEIAEFWRTVYLTDCAIKEKKPKPRIADKQDGWEVAVIRWYNGLHTDSSEYKMWGNGIALPNALYVMQGIADVMSEEKTARRKWLDDLLGGCL